MSFCRWSCDNFRCDLYCYECVDGTYTTHVACNRVVTPIIPSPALSGWVMKIPKLWRIWNRLHHWSVMHGVRRPIGLPWDGETFKDPGPEEWKQTLLQLRAAGYRFPDRVLDAANHEIEALAAQSFEATDEPI